MNANGLSVYPAEMKQLHNTTMTTKQAHTPETISVESTKWSLHELDPQSNGERRWSVGVNGPRAYLTCDKETAELIASAPALKADNERLRAAMERILAFWETEPIKQQTPRISETIQQARAALKGEK